DADGRDRAEQEFLHDEHPPKVVACRFSSGGIALCMCPRRNVNASTSNVVSSTFCVGSATANPAIGLLRETGARGENPGTSICGGCTAFVGNQECCTCKFVCVCCKLSVPADFPVNPCPERTERCDELHFHAHPERPDRAGCKTSP